MLNDITSKKCYFLCLFTINQYIPNAKKQIKTILTSSEDSLYVLFKNNTHKMKHIVIRLCIINSYNVTEIIFIVVNMLFVIVFIFRKLLHNLYKFLYSNWKIIIIINTYIPRFSLICIVPMTVPKCKITSIM